LGGRFLGGLVVVVVWRVVVVRRGVVVLGVFAGLDRRGAVVVDEDGGGF
jgi:hypothetical protein